MSDQDSRPGRTSFECHRKAHTTHPLLLENVPLWASQGFFISGELKRFYPGGIFTILKESKLNMTKYLNRNPAAGS
jgi:hypothetical protein